MALLSAVFPSSGSGAQSSLLRYKYTPGQTRHFQMHMMMTTTMLSGPGAGVPISTDAAVTWMQTVQSVRASDGAATIVTQLGDMQMTMNGRSIPLPAAQKAQMSHAFTSVILPTGKVLSLPMPALPRENISGMDFSKGMFSSNIAFPQAPVKVGSSWQGTATSGMAGAQILMVSQLIGLKPMGSAKLASIRQKLSGNIHMAMSKHTSMAGTMSGSGFEVFDATAGAVRSQTMTASANLTITLRAWWSPTAATKLPHTMRMKMEQKTELKLLDNALVVP